MSDTSQNNKRIAKNTLLLYVRMFFIMSITLFTSRVVLSTLGVVDFGIYNVVGGVVAMLGVLNGAMSVSTQRYLTFELGRGDSIRLRQVFSTCLLIFFILSLVIVILAETIGLWFLNTQMVIPEDRILAANWVYQFSILTCITSLIVNPYNAVIIAHERMNVYAYVGILEVMLKLGVVYLLLILPMDRLSSYGGLIFISHLVITGIYIIYCLKRFSETRFSFYWEKSLFMELISYSGWNLFGSLSSIVKGQGLNILINMFFNPSVNAARGIAYQINNAINQFFTNFFNAVRPQITKYYAQKDLDNLFKLVFRSSKLSFFLIYVLALPITIEAPYIVQLWLGQLPEYVVPFTRLIVIITAVDAMANPLMTCIHATGNIKFYQALVGTLIILNVPVSYLILRFTDSSPIIVFEVSLVINVIALFVRVFLLRHQIKEFPVLEYFKEVIGKSLLVSTLSFFITYGVTALLPDNFMRLVIVVFVGMVVTFALFLRMCLNKEERNVVIKLLKNRIVKK